MISEEMLRLVAMPDEQRLYHFDEMGYEPSLNTWTISSARFRSPLAASGSRTLPQ